MNETFSIPPYKSVAASLLFSVILGPIGVLYSSFWAGTVLIVIGFFVVGSGLFFPILFLWLFSCMVSVGMAERYNKRISQR